MPATTAAQKKHDHEDIAPVADLVCGMLVDPETAEFRHEHEGDEFLFCTDHCRGKFAKDPQCYLDGRHRSASLLHRCGCRGDALEHVCAELGYPKSIRIDQGPE